MALIDHLKPLVRALPPEPAHNLAISALRMGFAGRGNAAPSPRLRTHCFGLTFNNPVGLAAGFDKDGRAPAPLFSVGFGFVEVGTTTPKPQPGNPKPRLFRLTQDRAVINRMGFNNEGHEALALRLNGMQFPGPLGVNLGRNKDQTDEIADYVAGVQTFAGLADYLTVNVSSPNTPGLRALQDKGPLLALLNAVMAARTNSAKTQVPVLLKIAPDLTDEDVADVATVALETAIDGIIATNTTIARPADLCDPLERETGGLSGRPLFQMSTHVLRRLYQLTEGQIPLVGVGGIASGEDAYAKIRAGASLVQLYSALVYEGPGLVIRILRDLDACLARGGFASVADAVGADFK